MIMDIARNPKTAGDSRNTVCTRYSERYPSQCDNATGDESSPTVFVYFHLWVFHFCVFKHEQTSNPARN